MGVQVPPRTHCEKASDLQEQVGGLCHERLWQHHGSTDDHRADRSGSAGPSGAAGVVLDAGPRVGRRVVVREAQRMATINVRTRADASNAYRVVWRDGGSTSMPESEDPTCPMGVPGRVSDLVGQDHRLGPRPNATCTTWRNPEQLGARHPTWPAITSKPQVSGYAGNGFKSPLGHIAKKASGAKIPSTQSL